MIISKINGGLGNQMFQYAIAKAIAIKHNKTFKLDITAYETYTLHNGYRLNIFNIEENIATEKDVERLKGKENIFNKILNKFNLLKNVYTEKERTIFDKGVFLRDDIYLDGYWQNEEYFCDIRDEILKDFSLKENNTLKVKEYLEQINNTNSVSIHIRRGDYSKHPEIGILDISYYIDAINFINTKIKNPTFYIFSNDIEWCKSNFDFIGNKVFICDTKTEVDDMTLMRNCRHYIVANSSFSWWSAWLNENEDKIVIAPKKWMAINPNNYKWSPSNWVEL